jgi:putative ABC transport system substrate-binding protein
LATRAQSAAPRTIGYLSPRSSGVEADLLIAFRKGLSEAGYVEGRNLTIEYRWADGQYDRLPSLAADLARRQVAVIATSGGPQPARAARAATPSIPIVFLSGSDPVRDGLVSSLNRPGGNMTGISVFTSSLGPKRLEVLRELVPKGSVIAFLVNPSSQLAERQVKEIEEAARTVGQRLYVLNASTEAEIDRAFATLVQRKASGLLMSADLFFQVQREQLIALAARHAVPTMYEWREFVAAGGLISYSTVRSPAYVQGGTYVGRILNGAKPGDLPVIRSTAFELVLNLKTAKRLGLNISRDFLARVDEVIQ